MIRLYTNHGHQHMIGRTEVRVRIHHRPEEGYPLAGNGEEIKEDLPLRELLERMYRAYQEDSHKKVEEVMYEVAKVLNAVDTNAIKHIERTYDVAYAKLFRTGKLVLPEHTMSNSNYNHQLRGFVDPYQDKSNYQKDFERQMLMQQTSARYPSQFAAMVQSDPAVEKAKKEEFLRANEEEEKRKESEDIYYLLTDDQENQEV